MQVLFLELIGNLNNSDFSYRPDGADIVVLAVAGPVEDNVRSRPPLIGWEIDISKADIDFGFNRCFLINDFIAQAFACNSPIALAAEKILPGLPAPEATTAIIGAGTGLGKAAIMPDGKGGFITIPSEGGHTNFPFVSARELNTAISSERAQRPLYNWKYRSIRKGVKLPAPFPDRGTLRLPR